MCGIVGVCSNFLSIKERELFAQMLYVDAVRGFDSTGVLVVDSEGSANVIKAVGCPDNLIETKEFSAEVMANNKAQLLLGHNRAATRGKVTIENAHPFTVDHITLVHNGSLYDHAELSDKNHDVDSEAIAYAIAKNGIVEASKKIDGSYSLVWFNSEDNTLNFARNKDRPMHMALIANSSTLVWASEKGMLEWILARCGYNSTVEATPVLKHIKFPVKGPYKTYQDDNLAEYTWENAMRKRYSSFRGGANEHGFYSSDLSGYGKKIGDKVKFTVYDKVRYNTNQGWSRGTIKGMIEDEVGVPSYVDVVVYGANVDDFNTHDIYIGEIRAFSTTYGDNRNGKNNYQTPVFVVKEESVKKVEQSKKEIPLLTSYKGPGGKYMTGYKIENLLKGGCSVCNEELKLEDCNTLHWIGDLPVCNVCYHDPNGSVQ